MTRSPRLSWPEVPAHLTSRMQLAVRFCETDLMGIVHHANYLVYCEAGRVDWLHKRGVKYDEFTKRGVHLPVVESALRYRKAARFDEELVITTTCLEVSRVTILFGYVVTRGNDRICEAETRLACVGHDLALKRVPAELAEIFRSAETAP